MLVWNKGLHVSMFYALKVCMCVLQTVQTSVSVLCGTEQLIGSLPEVKWAKQVVSLATELQEHCLHTIVIHLPRIIHTTAFHSLRRVWTHTYSHWQQLIHNPAFCKIGTHSTASLCALIWLCFYKPIILIIHRHTLIQSNSNTCTMYRDVFVTVK